MLTIIEKQKVINPINDIIVKVRIRKTDLEFAYEKWTDDCIEQSTFSLEVKTPINSKLSNRSNLIDTIDRDVISYKELVVKFLQLDLQNVTLQGCLSVVEKACTEFDERLKLYDQLPQYS